MKIAFDVSYVQRKRAGHGRCALEIVKALLAIDKRNEYLLHGWSASLDVDEIKGLKQGNVLLRVARVPGLVKRLYWNQVRFPAIERFIGDFDLFHSTDPFLPPIKRGKGVAMVHDLSQKRFPQFFERTVLRWDRFVHQAVMSADAIIVPSAQTRFDLLEMFHIPDERVHLVQYPVHDLFHREADTAADMEVKSTFHLDAPFALFVGTIEPRKNLLALVKAFEELQRVHKTDLCLVLAGKRGWMYEDIFKAIRISPSRSLIRYLKYVSDRELASLYRLAQFFVYPSLYEGFGFPVLEAMASGTAVVTSNSSSLKELAEGAALLIDPTDTAQLVHAMYTLAHDASRRAELAKAGVERAKQFSPPASAEKILSLYQFLM